MSSNKIVLTYLPTGGRAEAIRLTFAVGGVPFTDSRVSLEQFLANQTDHSRFPTEQLPVLEVNGRKYTQAMAILRFAGKLGGLYPFDPMEALAVDEALDHVYEIYASDGQFAKTAGTESPLMRSLSLPPRAASAVTSPELGAAAGGTASADSSGGGGAPNGRNVNGRAGNAPGIARVRSGSTNALTEMCRLCFRRVCELINTNNSPFIASFRPTVADIAVYVLVRQIKKGALPHVPPELLDAPEFGLLHGLVDVIDTYPGVEFFYQDFPGSPAYDSRGH